MFFWFGWILFGLIFIWTFLPVVWFVGRRLHPATTSAGRSGDKPLPRVSIIVPACNEERAVGRALNSLLTLDYPDYEVLAVNDRSTDRTGAIMEEVAAQHAHCQVLHIEQLPDGWLGKNHAMHKAAQAATGDLLLFTDGDVIHEPNALVSAVRYLREQQLQHLCLLPRMIKGSFLEDAVVAFFGLAFSIGQQVHLIQTSMPFSYAGVGAFNLLDAEFYRSFGGHQPLALDVIDDAKLGKLVKRHGGRQDFLGAPDLLSLRWYHSLWDVITGLEKNGFAALGYSLLAVLMSTLVFLGTMIFPYVGAIWGGWPDGSGFLAAVLWWHLMYAVVVLSFSGNALLIFLFPVAASLISFAFLRSAWKTVRQGGVRWRTTFYPLALLKSGIYK